MTRLARSVMHPLWIPGVLVCTIAALVPRALGAERRMSLVGRAAGVYGAEVTDANDLGGVSYRWLKRRAAFQEPVQGRFATIPLFVARPGTDQDPLVLRIAVEGVGPTPFFLTHAGWHLVRLDLASLLGQERLRALKAVTFTATIDADSAPLRVGIGYVDWSDHSPDPTR